MKLENFEIIKLMMNYDFDDAELWLSEAQFGFSQLHRDISQLPANSKILEVGCGSGILLSVFSNEFPIHSFSGIEPFGGGFSALKDLNHFIQKSGVNIKNESYQEHKSKYDFIYCVNVFEHVEDWRHFLNWASESLTESGQFVVLCPNYGFPYESHFRIPIIFNKKITAGIFKKKIIRFERDNNCSGLWESLNFVKKRNVLDYCAKNVDKLGFFVSDDTKIIDFMILRVSNDFQFRKRQAIIGRVAALLKYAGIINILMRFPFLLPYMKLSFKKMP